MEKIKIGITQGDINGIGYEVILKTLNDNQMQEFCTPVIYGSAKIASLHRKNLEAINFNYTTISSATEANPRQTNIVNCVSDETPVSLGQPTKESGEAALKSLTLAVDELKKGHIDVLVTAPINKDTIQSENFHFPGHTEFLENHFGNKNDSLMLMVSEKLRIAVATTHLPLKNVSSALTKDLIVKKLQILKDSLVKDFAINLPRIAVLGLNPHAGDNGVLGMEEKDIIIPALKEAEEKGILCVGPFPADGFFGSDSFTKFDAVLAMYHDQGMIPFKNIAMESGVNYTAGLSIVRTSPAHGTAYDITGKDIASESSFRNAMWLACDIFRNRQQYAEISKNPLAATDKK